MPPTRSSRIKKATNYALDPFKDLDLSDNDDGSRNPSTNPPSTSVAAAEEEEEEEKEDKDEDDEDDAADPEFIGRGRINQPSPSPPSGTSSSPPEDEDEYASTASASSSRRSRRRKTPHRANPAPRLHKPHVFRVNRVPNASPGQRRRDRQPAAQDAAPGALRPPDPSVKITYRPGFIKSTGKRERIITTYGQDNDTLVKAIGVRDEYIGLPAVPERKGLRLTPFWREGEEVVQVGVGEQRVEGVMAGEERERFLPVWEEGKEVRVLVRGGVVELGRFGVWKGKGEGEGGEVGGPIVINAGGHVAGIEWVPNRPKGPQYLLISTKPDSALFPIPQPPSTTPPAFDRTPGPSCIQLWRFPISEKGPPRGPPRLHTVFCHEWGVASSLKFCQVHREMEKGDLGLAAAVFKDGNVRVISIRLSEEEEEEEEGETRFVKLISPAYTLSLPTPATTLSWLTTSRLITGHASGFISTWDLTHPLPLTPYLHTPIHQTYIASLTTCHPSFPTHVVSASLDGYCRITSLLDPYTDTVVNNRSRIAPTSICWVDAINAAVSSEEGAWVKFYPLRRFFSATTVAKHGGVVTGVAASSVHAFVLSGGSEGEAVVCNPVRRTFHGKIKNYQQTWFQLEYARKTNMLRMSEGFKLEEFETKSEKLKRRQTNTALVHSTAYPEQSNITQVCWNQNLVAGGWATAGTACGLVRVEDIAIDD